MLGNTRGFVRVAAATALSLLCGAAPAQAQLKPLTKTTSTVVSTTTSTTTTVLQPVTQPVAPLVQTVVEPVATTAGDAAAATTETASDSLGAILEPMPEDTATALNAIPAGYDPIAPLAALLGGTQGFPGAVEQLACPPATEAGELLAVAGAGAVGDGLTTLACRASMLEYRFYTRFRTAGGGTLAREHVATLGLPTALDVDEDLGPDLVGTITLTGVNTVGLVIERLPHEDAGLPVAVEAVLRDATRASLGRERIAFGYDARDDEAPGQFVLSTAVDTVLRPSPEFLLTLAQRDEGKRIAVTGAIFDGALDDRRDPAEVRLDYGRSPDEATIRARVGGDEALLALTVGKAGPATLSGRIVDGADEQRFDARIADLPRSFQVTAGQRDGVTGAAMTASDPIARVEGSFERLHEAAIARKAVLDLSDVPVGVALRLSGDEGAVETTGGPIGHTRVGTANGEPVFLAGQPAYLSLHEEGGLRSVAAAVPGLRSATFTLGDAPRVSAEMAPTPFLVRIRQPGRTLGADVLDLPGRFDLGLDLAAGTLDYDGHGSGIERLTLAGDAAEPFFGRATKLRGTIEGIPAKATATLGFGAAGGEMRIDGGALRRVQLVASNGSEELPPGDEQGAIHRDVTGGDYLVSLRLLGLRRIAFGGGAEAISLATHTAGGPFSLAVQTDRFTASGRIADLPAQATLGATPAEGRLVFSGRDEAGAPAGIDALDLEIAAAEPLFGRADHLRAHVEGIPADLTLDMAQGGDGTDIVTSDAIGLAEVVAANRAPADGDLPAGGEQGVRFTDLAGGEYVLGARVRELRRLNARLGAPMTINTETAGGPFGIRLQTDELRGHVRVEDLPRKLAATLDLAAGALELHGRDADGAPRGIDRILVDLEGDAPLLGRATSVHAVVAGVAPDLRVDLARSGDGVDVTASDPIGLLEVVARDGAIADPAADLPAGGEQGVKLVDVTGGEYAIGARLRKLTRLAGSFGDALAVTAHTEGGPFGIRVVNDDLRGHARIEDLPARLDLGLDLDAGKLTVQGRDAAGQPQGIDRIRVTLDGDRPLFGGASDLDAHVERVPSDVTVDLAQTGSGVRVAADRPIGLVELVAAGADIADPQALLPAEGEQGAVYRDAGGEFLLAARVRELQRLEADMAGGVSVKAITAGGPFRLLADAGGVRADARLRDLPADVEATLDPATGTFGFRGRDAAGAPRGVDLVTVDVDADEPLFGRATRLSARIEELPDTVDLRFDAAGGTPGAEVTASAPIRRLEVLATDGATAMPAPLTDPAAQGAVVRDLPGEPYVAALRVLALRRLAMRFGDDLGVEALAAGGPFSVAVDTEALGIDASVLDLPPDAKLDFDMAAGTVAFHGRDAAGLPQGIDLLTVDGRVTDGFLGRADRLSARIEKLPADVQVGFSRTGGSAAVDASAPLQLVELFAWEAGEDRPVLAADQGVLLHDRAGEPFRLAARVRELEELRLDFGQAMQLTARTAGGLFDADVRTEGLEAKATIDRLPRELTLALDPEAGDVTYSGSAPIDRIFASISSPEPAFLGATAFEVDLKRVPQSVALGLGTAGEGIRLTADNPIGQIDVRARSANRAYPAIAAGEAGAVLDSTNGELALALRVFELKTLSVDLEPMALEAEMQGGRRFLVDARIDSGGAPLELDGVIDQLPSKVRLALEDNVTNGAVNGSRLVMANSAPIGFVRLAVGGLELLPGADTVEAELNDVPHNLTVTLPQTGSLARVDARNAAGALTAIGQLRLAASDGSKALPAYVSDAQYNASPTNTGYRDRLQFDNSPSSFGVALRLTGPKLIDINLDPIALSLEQDGARTRPIAIDARIPNSNASLPATTVAGVLNKPSARTVVGVDVRPGQPQRLTFENAAAVGSLSLDAANLGTIPTASFSLSNIPTKLSVCMEAGGACRRADRLPSALSNYGAFDAHPAQNATAGGMNRPYPASVSMDFDDHGTSGTSSSVSSMVTLNATIKLTPTADPITITNLRFHRLSLDMGQHPTSPTFTYSGATLPRMYMFLDSRNLPFVMNDVRYRPSIESFKLGTDGNTANGDRRLVWLPGSRCTSSLFGSCITRGLDNRTSGSLHCGNRKELIVRVIGLNINVLEFPLLGQILSVCSSGG